MALRQARLTQPGYYTKSGIPIQTNLGISGLMETQLVLREIPVELREKVLKKAVRSAGKILQANMFALAPRSHQLQKVVTRVYKRKGKEKSVSTVESGILRYAISSSKGLIIKKNWDEYPIAWVGPAWRKQGRPYNAWYAHFAEFGTKFYGKHAPRTGWRYVQRAFENTKDRCADEIKRQVRKSLEKYNRQ